MPNGNSVVTMKISMHQAVRDDNYRYITEN